MQREIIKDNREMLKEGFNPYFHGSIMQPPQFSSLFLPLLNRFNPYFHGSIMQQV